MVWVERICFIDLVHQTLQDDLEAQRETAAWMVKRFPHLENRQLHKITYVDAVAVAKGFFANIPRKLMRESLLRYLSRTLNYLSAGVVMGIAPDLKEKVNGYVNAIVEGKLTSLEGRVTELVVNGSLRGDQLARQLVPALLEKSNKIMRGKDKRTGSSAHICPEGIQDWV